MGQSVPTTLYEVVDATCTIGHVQKLLRQFKDKGFDAIRITGATKQDVIGHLRDAVNASLIPEAAVVELVRDHEESGDQHIFYYRPNDDSAATRLNDGQSVGRTLLGARLTDGSLPAYKLKPKDFVWADFRFTKGGGTWTAKIYGHQERLVFKRQEEKPTHVIRYFDKNEGRVVCLCHWNGQELELRVSRIGAGTAVDLTKLDPDQRQIDRRADKMWEFLAASKIRKLVAPWELTKCQRTMLQKVVDEVDAGIDPNDSELPFNPSSVRFRDSGFGTAEFHSYEEEEGLATAEDRHTAIRVYLDDSKAQCRRLVVSWDPNLASGMWGEQPLRTVIGSGKPNEIIIATRVNSRTVQYVTNWLRQFGG